MEQHFAVTSSWGEFHVWKWNASVLYKNWAQPADSYCQCNTQQSARRVSPSRERQELRREQHVSGRRPRHRRERGDERHVRAVSRRPAGGGLRAPVPTRLLLWLAYYVPLLSRERQYWIPDAPPAWLLRGACLIPTYSKCFIIVTKRKWNTRSHLGSHRVKGAEQHPIF